MMRAINSQVLLCPGLRQYANNSRKTCRIVFRVFTFNDCIKSR